MLLPQKDYRPSNLSFTTTLLFIFSLLGSTCANAEIFKCVDTQGKTVFSDTPCSPNAEKITVDTTPTGMQMGQNPDGSKLQFQYKNRAKKSSDASKKNDKTDVCKLIQSTSLKRYAIQHKIITGMKMKNVIDSWGNPSAVHGDSDPMWAYRFPTGTKYVFFENGCVRKIES